MKILLLTQYYPPEPGFGSMKMSELAEDLAQKGHQVTVVTAYPNRPLGKVHDGYRMGLWMRERINQNSSGLGNRMFLEGTLSLFQKAEIRWALANIHLNTKI